MRLQQWAANGLTLRAFELRSVGRYALHPVEAALQYHGASAEGTSAPCDASVGFEQAEGIYRAGAQRLRLSEIPQLPQQLRELSRSSMVDLHHLLTRLHQTLNAPSHPIRNRLLRLTSDSPDLLAIIKQEGSV